MPVAIVDRGDGPKIDGTRTTVYDVYYYQTCGRSRDRIMEILRISPEQLQAALDYIEEHKDHVVAVHQYVEERNARGNPPEVEAKLVGVRERMKAWLEARRAQALEGDSARNGSGR